MSRWSVCYKKAIRPDGTLLFPERLTEEFLVEVRKSQGSYIFANQYQNEILPDGETPFRKEWNKYYSQLPKRVYTFAFIDPAISLQDSADYTACVVIDVDPDGNWYVKHARRQRINPTKIVEMCFDIQAQFNCMSIGIEDVAYQKALLYMLDGEMRRRNVILPVTGVKPPSDKSKEMKIMGLVPRFEWGRILLAQGLHDLELELAQFPRGSHDDLIDALSSLDVLVTNPPKENTHNDRPNPNSREYESWYIRDLIKRKREEESELGSD